MNWSDPSLAGVARVITAETGLAFPPARRPYSEAALRRIMQRVKLREADAFAGRLRTDDTLMRDVIDQVTIGETYFFRDPDQFEVLRAQMVQRVLTSGVPRKPIRLWSAGCSSGEEAYSLAIMMAQSGLLDRTYVLATDLSQNAVAKGRLGTYSRWSFREKTSPWREHWLLARGESWIVPEELRANVEFEVENLAHPSLRASSAPFDVILCRNVLMYLEPEVGSLVLQVLARSLAPGGWLLTSAADPVPPEDAGLEAVITAAGIVYRRPLAAQSAMVLVPPEPVEEPSAPLVLRQEKIEELVAAGVAQGNDFDPETHAVLAMLLLDLGLPSAAVAPAKRAILLDRSLAVAHLTLGRALRLGGRKGGARRALRRALTLLAAMPSDEIVRCAGGSMAGALAAHGRAELEMLERVSMGVSS